MNKRNTLLGQLLSFVSRPRFENLVKITQADKHCKGFTAWQQFVTMSYAQLANSNGLRSLENSLNSNHTSLYHLGIHKNLKRSTISYANNNRSYELFEKLLYCILETLNPCKRNKFRKDFYAVDATEVSLNMHDFSWAEFRSTKSGGKVNMKYDINNNVPSYLFITNAKEHENNTLCVTGAQTGKRCPFPLRIIKPTDEKTGNEITILMNILTGRPPTSPDFTRQDGTSKSFSRPSSRTSESRNSTEKQKTP